jgi:hypothetical protein
MLLGRLFLCSITVLLSACSDVGLDLPPLDGTYHGTFTITEEGLPAESGTVTFTFSGDGYFCRPERKYVPPSGGGLFLVIGRTMTLTDTAVHTAEFDWSLILGGEFSFTFDGSRLLLEQQDQKHQRHRTIDLRRQSPAAISPAAQDRGKDSW